MPPTMAACQLWPTQSLDEGKCTFTEHSSELAACGSLQPFWS